MRFMLLINADPRIESGAMPTDEKIFVEMGKFNQELIDAGAMVAGDGFHPSAKDFRVTNTGDGVSVTDGPFENRSVIAGFWIIEAASIEEAVEWTKRVPFEAGVDVASQPDAWSEIEIREIFSGCGAGEEVPSPGGSLNAPEIPGTLKYCMFWKSDEAAEAGLPPDEETLRAMGEGMAEMHAAGVVIGGEGLVPSSQGKRVRFTYGKRTVIDGPFAETKELVAGFMMLRVKTEEEAMGWAKKGVRIGGIGTEIEARRVMQAVDFPAELQEAIPEVFEAEREFRERASL